MMPSFNCKPRSSTTIVDMVFKILFLAVLCMVAGIEAQTESNLRNAIITGSKLTLTKTIKLTRDLPPIPDGKTVELEGRKGVSIDGQKLYTMFKSSENGAVTLSLTNLIITGAVAKEAVAAAVDINGVLKVKNVDFKSNNRAIYGRALTATISNSQFISHSKTAIVVQPGSAMTISGSKFTSNRADSELRGGGAIFVYGSYDNWEDRASITVSKTTFSSNFANGFQGGAVYLGTFVAGRFSDCTFKDNSAYSGGAVYTNNGHFRTQQCAFEKNRAALGGAIVFRSDGEGNSNLIKSKFTGNTATTNGGAFVMIHEATPIFCSCEFKSNRAKNVPNNGWGDRDSPAVGISPPGAGIPLVTVEPGQDPPVFFNTSCQ